MISRRYGVRSVRHGPGIHDVFDGRMHLQNRRANHIVTFSFEHPGVEKTVVCLVSLIKELIDVLDLAR
jgi:hypothetical protein